MIDHFDFFLDETRVIEDLDINLVNIGYSHNQPNYSNGYDRREYYILHYIIDGCGNYTVNGTTWELEKNDGFVVPANTTVIYRANKKNPWTVYWVGFYGRKSTLFLSRINVTLNHPIFRMNNDGPLSSCMENMYKEVQKQSFSYELLLGYFYQVIGLIQKDTVKESILPRPTYYYQSTVQFIKNNIRLPLKVQDLANNLQLSTSQVYRITMKNCGLSPHELIEKIKMEKAADMLIHTNISIHEISLLLGYEYTSHFFLVFKRLFHTTPGEYRKNAESKSQ